MKNGNGNFRRLTLRMLGALLMLCACFLVGNLTAFGQTNRQEEVPDSSYGAGGTKRTHTITGPFKTTVQVEVRDPQGVLREYTSTTTQVEKGSNETVIFYDCNGKKTYEEQTTTDSKGNKVEFKLERYEAGKQISGIQRFTDSSGKEHSQTWNPETGNYKEDVVLTEWPSSKTSRPQHDTSVCPINHYTKQPVGGFNIICEDSEPDNFKTYGFNIDYTRLRR